MSNADEQREKRASSRVQLEDFQRVKDAATGKLIGYLGDISAVGVKVLCKEGVPIGDQFTLNISYIRLGGEKVATEVEVESIWERDEEQVPFREIGFRFLALDDNAHEGVQRIIEDLDARRNN